VPARFIPLTELCIAFGGPREEVQILQSNLVASTLELLSWSWSVSQRKDEDCEGGNW